MLVAPARHLAVEHVEDESQRCHCGRQQKVRKRTAGHVHHRQEHRQHAAGGIPQRDEVGQMKAADHREAAWRGARGRHIKVPSLAVIKQGTRRRVALRWQQRSWASTRRCPFSGTLLGYSCPETSLCANEPLSRSIMKMMYVTVSRH